MLANEMKCSDHIFDEGKSSMWGEQSTATPKMGITGICFIIIRLYHRLFARASVNLARICRICGNQWRLQWRLVVEIAESSRLDGHTADHW